MLDFYLFDTGWGLLFSLLIPIVFFRLTLLGAIRQADVWEIGKALLIVLGGWFLLGTFPKNLVWLWDFLKWIDYDILFVGLFVLMVIAVIIAHVKDNESLQLIYGCVAGVSFAYIFFRVVHLYATGKTDSLLAFLL